MSEAPPAFWPPLLWRGLTAFALGLPVFALNVWERSLDSETRFTPELVEAQHALCLLPLLSLISAVVFIVRRYSASTRSFSRVQRFAWIFVVLLAQLVFAFAALFTGAFTKPDWLFGPGKPYVSLRSPDGKRTAYGTRHCTLFFNFCSLDIHVQEGRGLTMRKTQYFPEWKDARLAWRSDSSGVQVIDEKGAARP